MPLEKGSLILVNYTARVKDTGEVIETTIEEDAKKGNIYDPNRVYEPRLLAVGEGWILKGVDEALLNANVGDNLTIEVPPSKAFGNWDQKKVKMIPLRRLGDKAEEVKVGDAIEMDNKIGIVRFIGSGRVQIDFNHKLAGKTLEYSLQILKKLEDDEEKIKALIRRRLPIEEDKLKFVREDDKLDIEIPNEYVLQEGLQIIKRAIANDILRYVGSINKIRFIESYEREVKEEKEESVAKKE
ncbi:MAG: peptidylprolyl isomerase [Candidatus Nitrosocaldaceae archaeon]|nr:MAG: peptidylprolyl isomerase [Candidatus Nitrosocaldaceae archaeon]